MLTSLGYHTFTIFLRLTFSEALMLYNDFKKYKYVRVRPIGKDKKNPKSLPKAYIVEYIDKYRGITWYVRFDDKLPVVQTSLNHNSPNYQKEHKPYSVRATINPKILVGIIDYLKAANSDYLEDVEAQFNSEAAKISSILGAFEHYSVNRVDYCLNIDVDELRLGCSAKQLIYLIRQGNIPRHFKEWKGKENIKKSHRKEPNKNAMYLQSNSITFNCYYKYKELLENFPECPDLESFHNLIRIEIQCYYLKVYSLAKPNRYNSKLYKSMLEDELLTEILRGDIITNPIDIMLSDDIAAKVIPQYSNKVIRKGDYFTLDGASWMVEQHNFRREKENRLLWTLEQVNSCRGIAKAKAKLKGNDLREFKRSLKELDDILVNPVTIPRDWKIDHIANPLSAYYDFIFEEQFLTSREVVFNKYLTEYLS